MSLPSFRASYGRSADGLSHTGPVDIARDGQTVVTVEDGNAAFAWLLRHCAYSVSHAVLHEGWSVCAALTLDTPTR